MAVRAILVLMLAVAAALPAAADERSRAEVALIKLVHRAAGGRAALVKELAADDAVSVEAWLAAMRAFGQFTGAAGVLDAQADLEVLATVESTPINVYVPESYTHEKPAPLLMTFHGSGGSGHRGYAPWQSVADALGMIVVSPTDERGMGGFTGSKAEHAAGWAALRWARLRYNIDECRIHATGVSRGGHLLWDMALRRPDRLASIAPAIGGPLLNMAGGRNNIRYVENLVDVTIRDLQGSNDDRLLVANLRLTFDLLEKAGARDAKLVEFPDLGHSFRYDAVDWPKLLGETKRPAIPARVVRRAARTGEGRAHWVEILETRPPVKEIFQLRVNPKTWNAMDREQQGAVVAEQAEKHTARIEARFEGKGRFVVKTKAVKRFRLLLDPSMFEGDRIEVVVNGRTKKPKIKTDKRVLLREFAERFDRTFLPVAEVLLRP